MRPRWLYLLVIAALLLPGARPRFAAANVLAPVSGGGLASAAGTSTTVAEEEEVLERCSQRSRLKQARKKLVFVQPSLYTCSKRFFVATAQPRSAELDRRNGFGGPITC